jgi:hypothetical protein
MPSETPRFLTDGFGLGAWGVQSKKEAAGKRKAPSSAGASGSGLRKGKKRKAAAAPSKVRVGPSSIPRCSVPGRGSRSWYGRV